MVTVRVTETYDMKTSVGKLGIIGIHTPSGDLIKKLYPGLVKNHKFIRFKKCDVVGACASVLPADPLQVGVTSGAVAPEDMFNPILYKAVTNSSFDELVNRIYAYYSSTVGTYTQSVGYEEAPFPEENAFKVYYSLLSENGRFRKAMPQSGFRITNLRPICHTLVSTYGNMAPIGNKYVLGEDGETPEAVPDLTSVTIPKSAAIDETDVMNSAITFRGRSVAMPKLPLHTGPEAYNELPNLNLVKTFVAMLLIPPAKLHEFYYRMRVTWYVSFEGLITANEIATFGTMTSITADSYAKNYTYEDSKSTLDKPESSVDASDVDLEKIMES